jgi:CubicO group peptidase (beta-lactamase class C family)
MLVFAHSPISGRVSIAPRDWRRKIDEVGSAAIKARTAAGLAIAVVDDKRNTYARGYGLANLETGTPATEHSIFRIASLTKTFTAAALMKLVERGRVDLERRLSTFYGDIPGSENVTLYQLLSHTSGIHDYVSGGLPADALGWKTPDEFADGVRRMTPLFDFDPGTRFSYSNSGYILLGGIIEKTSGRSYAEFLAKEIFQPLGMTRTAVDHLEDVVEGRADGYAIQPGASPFKHAGYGGLPHAAGAMRSCAQDLALSASAFFAGDVVSAQSVRLMTQASRTRSGVKVGEARWWPNGPLPEARPLL